MTRFVVWGRHAGFLISRQPWNYAFGRDSALDRFTELRGRILLLGCDHDTVTFLHYAEHIVDIPGKRVATFKVPIDDKGTRVWREMEEFDSSEALSRGRRHSSMAAGISDSPHVFPRRRSASRAR